MDTVHIEPGREMRPHFALWCLAQEPPMQTASATGFDVPLDLYPSVPPELLAGAYVDGFLYGRESAPLRTPEAVTPAVVPEAFEAPLAAPVAEPLPRRPRKRAAKKASARPPVLIGFSSDELLGATE